MKSITQTLLRYGPLLVLVGLTVLPYAWLGQQWPWLGGILEGLFTSEAAHAIGHAAIFATLGAVFLSLFPGLRARPWAYLAIILSIALAQEGLQLLVKERGVILNDITDIGTDLVAASVIFALARAAAARRVHLPVGGAEA